MMFGLPYTIDTMLGLALLALSLAGFIASQIAKVREASQIAKDREGPRMKTATAPQTTNSYSRIERATRELDLLRDRFRESERTAVCERDRIDYANAGEACGVAIDALGNAVEIRIIEGKDSAEDAFKAFVAQLSEKQKYALECHIKNAIDVDEPTVWVHL